MLRRRYSLLLLSLCAAARAGAQYPLRPSPELDPASVPTTFSWTGYMSFREMHKGDSSSAYLRTLRLTVQVKPLPWAVVRVQGGYSNENRPGADTTLVPYQLTDVYVELVPPEEVKLPSVLHPALVLGQFKVPFSLEYLTSSARLLAPSRSQVVDRLAPRRDIGAMAQLDVAHRVVFAGAVVNGEGTSARLNTNNRQLAVGRITVLPIPEVALAAKWSSEGPDHRWGYDGRWIHGPAVAEFETVHRQRTAPNGTVTDAGGEYVLATYRFAPWLAPLVKWEQYDQARPTRLLSTWVTYGVGMYTKRENLHAIFARVDKTDRPAPGTQAPEYIAQLLVNF